MRNTIYKAIVIILLLAVVALGDSCQTCWKPDLNNNCGN